MLPWDQVPRDPHLLDYVLILRKHQWLILTFLLTVVTVVTIASFKMKPVYQATARVEVDRESQNNLPFQGGNPYDEYMDMENYIETQAEILQSETLALQTIKSLDLERYPEYGGSGSSTAVIVQPAQAAGQRPAILGAFLGSLSVRRVPNSQLIEVTFEGGPEAGGEDRERAPAELHRAEFPKQVRRDHAGFHLAFFGTGRACGLRSKNRKTRASPTSARIRSGRSTRSRTSPRRNLRI